MWPELQETADLVTFTEEFLNGKLVLMQSYVLNIFRYMNFFLGVKH